jgi:hypothetical protein
VIYFYHLLLASNNNLKIPFFLIVVGNSRLVIILSINAIYSYLYCIFIRKQLMLKLNPHPSSSTSQSHMTERREKDFKIDARYIEEIRNAELINKKLLMHKKGVFPELHTSHTRKNFNALLSPYQKGDYSPVRRYQHP